MAVYHDEIEIEDMEYDEETEIYYYPCPCGDRFQITKEELESGEEVATCPSCSLIIKVIYDLLVDFPHVESDLSAADRNLDTPANTGDSHASKVIKTRSPVQETKAKGGSQHKKGSSQKSSASTTSEDSTECSGQHQAPGRKKRARSTPDETDANGRKSTTDFGGQRDGNLWLGGEGDGPVQGSLLEEVLAEKKMALLRSPEVIRFLQKRQSLLLVTQARNSDAMDFNAGEEEEEAGQYSS